ncbi:homeobox-containing protein [Plasmodium yoelii yoelii]|uniref:Homeobox-containing protein n=1 Tax=Plasmodium yoelii yoelii TaxID=73239 RepID=Q7RDH8_PLAYO|nr:homeobox-containing protein [Plasmodium yoelii yoelii]
MQLKNSINNKNDSKTDVKENYDKENVDVINRNNNSLNESNCYTMKNYNDSMIDMNINDYYPNLSMNGNNKIDVGSNLSRTHESKDNNTMGNKEYNNVSKDDINLLEENINNTIVTKNNDCINKIYINKQNEDNGNDSKECSLKKCLDHEHKPDRVGKNCNNVGENDIIVIPNLIINNNGENSSGGNNNGENNSGEKEKKIDDNIINIQTQFNVNNSCYNLNIRNNENAQNVINNNIRCNDLVNNNNINQNIDKCDEIIYNGYINDSKNNTDVGSIYLSSINLIKDSYNYEFFSNKKMVNKLKSTSNSSITNTEYL